MNTNDLRKAAKCVHLVTGESVADDLSYMLNNAADEIDELRDFAIWMTGCAEFTQHEYFCKMRDKLLK